VRGEPGARDWVFVQLGKKRYYVRDHGFRLDHRGRLFRSVERYRERRVSRHEPGAREAHDRLRWVFDHVFRFRRFHGTARYPNPFDR
jgi:hypothetical protein